MSLQGLLGSIGSEFGKMYGGAFYDPIEERDRIYKAAMASGMYSPEEADAMVSQWLENRNKSSGQTPPLAGIPAPMAQPGSYGLVNKQAVSQVAQGITQAQPQGEWWQQLGGFFHDRPALTQGLLTTGIGLMSGLPSNYAFSAGGQAMQGKQTAMAATEKEAYDRELEAKKFELETIKANTEILKALNEGGGGSYKTALEEAVKSGLQGEEAQRYAMFKQAGITPPIKNKRGFPYGLLGMGKQYTVVNK